MIFSKNKCPFVLGWNDWRWEIHMVQKTTWNINFITSCVQGWIWMTAPFRCRSSSRRLKLATTHVVLCCAVPMTSGCTIWKWAWVQKEPRPCWNSHVRLSSPWSRTFPLSTIQTPTGSYRPSWRVSHSVGHRPCLPQPIRRRYTPWPSNPFSRELLKARCVWWTKLMVWNTVFRYLDLANVRWLSIISTWTVQWRERLDTWSNCRTLLLENRHLMWVFNLFTTSNLGHGSFVLEML